MENVMTIERKSNLIMPTHYVELDKDEMSYVDGGIFLNQATVDGIMIGIVGAATQCGVAAIASSIKMAGSIAFKALYAIPFVGPLLAIVGSAWLSAQAWSVAEAFAMSMVFRKGINISCGWFFFFPIIEFNAVR